VDQVFSRGLKLMGNHFTFSVVSQDEDAALSAIDAAVAEVQRIESLLSTYREESEVNQINRNAGIAPVVVSTEVFDLIERSLRISALTQGAFDITFGSIDKSLWNFDTTMTSLPDGETMKKQVRLINFRNIIYERSNRTVMLREKGMRIGFGGIGKGYAADRAKAIIQRMGFSSGIVNAAGDLTVWGTQPSGEPWTIGIADPDQRSSPFASITLSDVSVATSGSYEKFAMINGKRYSHTIDPRTGYPVSGIRSVTIICKHAEVADAMATPVMVMGKDAGLDLINQMKGIACIIITDDNVIYSSKNINLN
jgi:FAD:protein FMN transferase